MRLRFVTCNDIASALIRDREGLLNPFTPSHVELVVAEGYLGAHDAGGVAIRPVGYDKAVLIHELFLAIPLEPASEAAAEEFARAKIGASYDWEAIVDFVLPVEWHEKKHLICSAFATLALRAGGLLPGLAAPSHAVSPRDLLLVLSAVYPFSF